MKFSGTNLLLIGVSSGIGAALVKKLANNDCSLILLARRYDKLQSLAESLKGKPARISIWQCDVSDPVQVADTISRVSAQYPRIDLALINSGVSYRNEFAALDLKKAQDTVAINLMGVINCFHALTPVFMKQRSGIIATVSSLADSRGFARSGVYSASKAAVTILLESASVELAHYGVKIITIRPGFVKTAMTDKNEFKMPFIIPAEKAADIIYRGIEKEKRYINFPGVTKLLVDIGRAIPNFIFEYFSKKQFQSLLKE
jgi:short-subunit dehydrogenase